MWWCLLVSVVCLMTTIAGHVRGIRAAYELLTLVSNVQEKKAALPTCVGCTSVRSSSPDLLFIYLVTICLVKISKLAFHSFYIYLNRYFNNQLSYVYSTQQVLPLVTMTFVVQRLDHVSRRSQIQFTTAAGKCLFLVLVCFCIIQVCMRILHGITDTKINKKILVKSYEQESVCICF